MKRNSCKCSNQKKRIKPPSPFPIVGGILIAILPKCPFCILAYSSAITLCSGKTLYNHAPIWSSYISIGLACLVLLFILLNYRGIRTVLALITALVGVIFLIISELFTGELSFYYWGSSLLFFGIWMNGSLYYFYRKFMEWFGRSSQIVLNENPK